MAIYDLTGTAAGFINEWESASPTVTAHTSGSTGAPKQVQLKKTDMEVSAKATCKFFGISSNSHLLLPISVDYIAGKMMIVRAIVSGADLTVLRPGNDILCGVEIPTDTDLVAIVPSQIPSLIQESWSHKFKHVIVGGAPMSSQQQQTLVDAGINAWATYGMTETCSHVALRHISSEYYEALPGFKFSVDSRGCLTINSDKMSFVSLQTNDKVNLISDIKFQWLGRYDNVINSGGIKIHPEEDEAILANVIPVPFYISSMPHSKWGAVPILVLEGTDNGKAAEYIKYAALLLQKYHTPKSAIWLPKFERTTSGKIKRKKF